MPAEKADFESLVALYEQRIFNVVYRMVGDYDEAADITQDAFIRAYRAFESFRGEAQPYTWLYRIAINLVRDHFAKHRRKTETEVSLESRADEGGGDWEMPDESSSPQRIVAGFELREQLEAAIDALPNGYRECVVLREFENLSYQEIADALGISVEAVRSRLARARQMIRRRIGPYLSW